MKAHIYYIIGILISGFLFTTLSIRNNWSKRLWARINRKTSYNWNAVFWLILTVIFQIVIMIILESFRFNNELIKLFMGITMGLSLGFIPYGQNKIES